MLIFKKQRYLKKTFPQNEANAIKNLTYLYRRYIGDRKFSENYLLKK